MKEYIERLTRHWLIELGHPAPHTVKIEFRKLNRTMGRANDERIVYDTQTIAVCSRRVIHELIIHEVLHSVGNQTHNKHFWMDCKKLGIEKAFWDWDKFNYHYNGRYWSPKRKRKYETFSETLI